MSRYTFKPDFFHAAHLLEKFGERDIEAEPQLYSASFNFAEARGGPITQAVLRAMPPTALAPNPGRHVVIDSRVHMLMPGMYPAIPGWHCDAWPRTDGGAGQPDPSNVRDKVNVRHWTAIVGDCSLTEFYPDEHSAYCNAERFWSSVSERLPNSERIVKHPVDGIMEFGPDQLHRASPATHRGWRFWLRLSHYQRPPQNKVRTQSQVYVTEHGGW